MTPIPKFLDVSFWYRFLIMTISLVFRCVLVLPFAFIVRKKGVPNALKDEETLVIFSQVPWWGVWQRPQEQALGLSRYFRIIFVCPVQIHEVIIHYKRWRRRESISSAKGIMVFSPLIFSGHYRSSLAFRINQWILAAELKRLLKGESQVIFLTNSPFIEPALRALPVSTLIYDIIDDFAAFDWAPANAEHLEQNLLKKSDIIITGTHALQEQKETYGKKSTFIPCGVDFDLFHDKTGEEPPDIRDLPKPLVGYMGTLSDRIDSSILRNLSKRLENASIILIGPVHGSLADPPRAPNIHYLGLKSHDRLPAYLHHVKVALLPFRLTRAVQAINPVKTLEYLAAGCAVVSTAIPDVVRFYSDTVVIAASPQDFVEKTAALLVQDNTDLVRKGIERARACSWESMTLKIRKIIGEYRSMQKQNPQKPGTELIDADCN
jgi:glycosyltransferase involved in cell wall biosynthesis